MNLKDIMEDYIHERERIIDRRFEGKWVRGAHGVGKTTWALQRVINERGLYVPLTDPYLRDMGPRKLLEEIERVRDRENLLVLDGIDQWKGGIDGAEWLSQRKGWEEFIGIGVNFKIQDRTEEMGPLTLMDFEFGRGSYWIGEIKGIMDRLMRYGGFPEAFMKESRKYAVKALDETLYKEILGNSREDDRITELYYGLMELHTGKYKSYRDLATEYEMSTYTAMEYLNKFEEYGVIFKVNEYGRKNKHKFYTIDVGSISRDRYSVKLENFVYLHLRKLDKKIQTYRTKSGKEIDFYGNMGIVEVTIEPDKEHIRKVAAAAKELKLKEGWIITEDVEDRTEYNGVDIKIMPAWMLGKLNV